MVRVPFYIRKMGSTQCADRFVRKKKEGGGGVLTYEMDASVK
jgi:hypothetical protein